MVPFARRSNAVPQSAQTPMPRALHVTEMPQCQSDCVSGQPLLLDARWPRLRYQL